MSLRTERLASMHRRPSKTHRNPPEPVSWSASTLRAAAAHAVRAAELPSSSSVRYSETAGAEAEPVAICRERQLRSGRAVLQLTCVAFDRFAIALELAIERTAIESEHLGRGRFVATDRFEHAQYVAPLDLIHR
jgi:hypothetical protein